MNKLHVVGLEGMVRVYDVRTLHPEHGFACVKEKVNHLLPTSLTCSKGEEVDRLGCCTAASEQGCLSHMRRQWWLELVEIFIPR